MKVTVCGSLAFHAQMRSVHAELTKAGHAVVIPGEMVAGEGGQPIPIESYYKLKRQSFGQEPWMWQRKSEDMRHYFHEIAQADAILVLNYEKEGVANYIGGNTVIEMGVAFYLNVRIYLLHEIPDVPWTEEIISMGPAVLHGDLTPLIENGCSSRSVAA